uniref:Uncharacterized protein n=1 Tax=Arundo donax TaxID=35708 RepID=A0A0A9BLC3_ARUDO
MAPPLPTIAAARERRRTGARGGTAAAQFGFLAGHPFFPIRVTLCSVEDSSPGGYEEGAEGHGLIGEKTQEQDLGEDEKPVCEPTKSEDED